jgi:hypothetical protein
MPLFITVIMMVKICYILTINMMVKLMWAGDKEGYYRGWCMEAMELEIRRRPSAEWSLLHFLRSWCCS